MLQDRSDPELKILMRLIIIHLILLVTMRSKIIKGISKYLNFSIENKKINPKKQFNMVVYKSTIWKMTNEFTDTFVNKVLNTGFDIN